MVDDITSAIGSGMGLMIGVGVAGMAMKQMGRLGKTTSPRRRKARRKKR